MGVWKKLLWFAVAALGTWAVAVLAISRKEHISALWIILAGLCALSISYRFYSKWLAAKVLVLNDERATPAIVRNDGKDFVPTNRWMVFGHHFAAIAGPVPLVGPILAAQFGYLPGTLWIVIGGVLGGCVQDFVTLFCSLRRDGRSLGQMAKDEISEVGGWTALFGVLFIMIILIAVVALVVVNALRSSPWGLFTIAMTIPIALLLGVYLRYLRPGRVLEASLLGLVLVMAAVIGGRHVAESARVAHYFTYGGVALAWMIILYGFAASVLPVWLLLAPRDYLHIHQIGDHRGSRARDTGGPPADAPSAFHPLHGRHGADLCRQGLPVLLHHHRLRRHLGLPLADRFRHDTQAHHEGEPGAHGRVRQHADGVFRG